MLLTKKKKKGFTGNILNFLKATVGKKPFSKGNLCRNRINLVAGCTVSNKLLDILELDEPCSLI